MAKLLAIAAIAAAVVGALTALVFIEGNPVQLLSIAVALACGVLLLLRRSPAGWVGGAVTIVLAILGALGSIGNVSTKGGGGTSLGITADWGTALLVCSLALVPAFAAWDAWGLLATWAAAVGIVAGLLAAIVALVAHGSLVSQNDPTAWAAGVACLLGVIPGILLLGTPEPAPMAEPGETVRAPR